jgi:hypothetical protein
MSHAKRWKSESGEVRRWTVSIMRWDVYDVPVEADSEEQAEERALERYENTDDYTHADGGVESVHAEPEE